MAPARFDLTRQPLTRDEERAIADHLRSGALIIYPTDTLYAIGCLATNAAALAHLRRAKGRDPTKALPVIAADLDQARHLSSAWPDTAQKLADAFWPGPLTLVVPAASDLPADLLAGATGIAVRVPASDAARLLAGLAGPLVSTSANLSGEPPCTTVELALNAFPSAILMFDSGPLDGAPSTIVDVTRSAALDIRILRKGRVSEAAIEQVVGIHFR